MILTQKLVGQHMYRFSYALVYYFSVLLLSGGVTFLILLFTPSVTMHERGIISDLSGLIATIAPMLSPTLRDHIEEMIARLVVKLDGGIHVSRSLGSGRWLVVGACFVSFYLLFIAIYVWNGIRFNWT